MMFGKNDKRSSVPGRRDEVRTIGSNISFAAKEAYKLLRTNLSYILSEKDAEDCHVIGVTSSLRGEGKSTTAVNLAYVLAEMNRKVLLLEGDMRIPSLHKKLKLQQKPGLSNALVNKSLPASSLQRFTDKTGTGFDVLTAGDIPPNPSELLASKRMQSGFAAGYRRYGLAGCFQAGGGRNRRCAQRLFRPQQLKRNAQADQPGEQPPAGLCVDLL